MAPAAAFLTLFGIVVVVSTALLLVYLRRMAADRSLPVLQRQARFYVFVTVVILAAYAFVVGAFPRAWGPSLGVLGLYGFTGLINYIGRGERREGKVIMDERDLAINARATTVGFATFWVSLFAAWIVSRFALGANATVSIDSLGWVAFGGAIIMMTVRALVVLAMYRRQSLVEAN